LQHNPLIIASVKLNIDNLKSYFKEREFFGSNDLFEFYSKQEPEVTATTINWRIYNLVQKGILHRVGRGKFNLDGGTHFIPELSADIKTLSRQLHKQYPYLKVCIWNTAVINEFMLHQPGSFFILIEVDSVAVESVFYFLKENKYQPFFDPDTHLISKYANDRRAALVVKSLVSESPCQNIQGVKTITIEKMLVDIYCDDKIFAAQQGSEMNHVFKEALTKYSVNENRMLRYAARRNKKKAFIDYLVQVSKYRQ